VLKEDVRTGTGVAVLKEDVRTGTGVAVLKEDVRTGTGVAVLKEDVRTGTGVAVLKEDVRTGTEVTLLKEDVRTGTGVTMLKEDVRTGTGVAVLKEDVRTGTVEAMSMMEDIRSEQQGSLSAGRRVLSLFAFPKRKSKSSKRLSSSTVGRNFFGFAMFHPTGGMCKIMFDDGNRQTVSVSNIFTLPVRAEPLFAVGDIVRALYDGRNYAYIVPDPSKWYRGQVTMVHKLALVSNYPNVISFAYNIDYDDGTSESSVFESYVKHG
jgi:hypothetical protein